MRKFYLTLLMIIIFWHVSCTGEGTSGSASGSGLQYHVSDAGGTAEGSFNKIKGTYPADFEVSIYNDDFVIVDLTASVEAGRLRVFIKDADDKVSEFTLEPGETGSLSGRAEVHFDETFRIYFDALDGEAQNITYTMSFRYEE